MKGSRDIKPFGLRMPPVLRKKLEKAAAINGRSLNSEIIQRLEFSFSEDSTKARLEEIEKIMKKNGLMK